MRRTRVNPIRHAGPRRGIAMMLVLMTVAMATILATSYLVSRDTTVFIARNNTAAAEARYAAISGLGVAEAIFQTAEPWRTNHNDGVLTDTLALGNATVAVSAVDLETGGNPLDSTEYVAVKVVATVDADANGSPDAEESTIMRLYVPREPRPRVAVDLAEFAVFAKANLILDEQATVARWPVAPLTSLGRRVLLGTQNNSSNSVIMFGEGACVDCTLMYEGPGASSLIVNNTDGPRIALDPRPFEVPFPAPPHHNEPPPSYASPDYALDGAIDDINVSVRFDGVNILNGAEVTLNGDVTMCVEAGFNVVGSRIVVNGNVTIIAFDFLNLDGSAIELEEGATLTLYVGKNLTLSDSYMGDVRSDTSRDPTGGEEHMDTTRLRLFVDDSVAVSSRTWRLQNTSVIKGYMYGDSIGLQLANSSAIYGRVAVETALINGTSAIFYDHALDERCGYSAPQTPLVESEGSLSTQYAGLASLDGADLQTTANGTSTVIYTSAATYEPPSPYVPATGTPTPRPIHVDREVLAVGLDMLRWEDPDTVSSASSAEQFDTLNGSNGGSAQ